MPTLTEMLNTTIWLNAERAYQELLESWFCALEFYSEAVHVYRQTLEEARVEYWLWHEANNAGGDQLIDLYGFSHWDRPVRESTEWI